MFPTLVWEVQLQENLHRVIDEKIHGLSKRGRDRSRSSPRDDRGQPQRAKPHQPELQRHVLGVHGQLEQAAVEGR